MARHSVRVAIGAAMVALFVVAAAPAHAYKFDRKLEPGMSGPDVKALQVRVAGWFPGKTKTMFAIDGAFGGQTSTALKLFQSFYGLPSTGVASKATFDKLDALEDSDHSTVHFAWSEFWQNRNSSCSARSNAYAGTFAGGSVSAGTAKKNVKRLMWRLEALRAKGGGDAIGINSGFRSVPYNQCIGGASLSQHLYGTAADNRMSGVTNHKERNLARSSQFFGIGCYARLTHNHFDLRLQNPALPSSQSWWWPERDGRHRDLDDAGRPCWGEPGTISARTASLADSALLREVGSATAGVGSEVPSPQEIEAFEEAGEVGDLGGGD